MTNKDTLMIAYGILTDLETVFRLARRMADIIEYHRRADAWEDRKSND